MGGTTSRRRVLGPHPALIEVAAGRGLPKVDDPMPLVRSALAHGMAGLLLTEVEQTDQPWRRLLFGLLRAREETVETWHKQLWMGLESISVLLQGIGVEVAAAKGIAAEARWYSRLGERPCADLDLLLSPADLDRIDDVIAAIEPSHPLCGKTRRLAERGFLESVDLKHDGVPIDLHWDIFKIGVPSRNREIIWERTVPLELPNGSSIPVLDPETSFVHFLVHLNKDRFRRLLGFVDVARVYEREDLDRTVVDQIVKADGLKTCIDGSWNTVVNTLSLSVPKRKATPGIGWLIWQIAWRSSVRLGAEEDSRMRFRHRQYLIALLSPGRAPETIRRWVRSRFPPADLLAYMYSDYARRWGGDPLTKTPRSRWWHLTIGRLMAWSSRRQRVAKAGPRRTLSPD
jgi:Uncharacterised nucleotidyltransferase